MYNNKWGGVGGGGGGGKLEIDQKESAGRYIITFFCTIFPQSIFFLKNIKEFLKKQ